tara:strand:+ start:317 stop:1183 length:867 start_codon:yes stop_codon:yes gene_type:complete
MADTIEMQDIRGLDIDKAVKGFALTNYIFKNLVTVSSMSGDSLRWYQETASDLTATSPSTISNVARLATPSTLEVSWTRQTSYARKYIAEAFISMEDMKTADIDVLARQLLRLTRAVVKQVDTRIYNILTEDQSPSTIGTAAATGNGWDDTTNGNPVLDIMAAKQTIAEADYDPEGGVVAMNPKNHKDLLNYLITVKGASIPQFSSEKVQTGVVMNLLGLRVVVSNNVVADSVWVGLPARACTWKTSVDTTSRMIEDPGLGTKIRVWEIGEPILTDPSASYLITDTDT